MKVFISSVAVPLARQREGLAALLRVVEPYDPIRFEDFTAQDRSSREACLDGVSAADVVVLLLGSRYGGSWADSGLSATHEEFELARRTGTPVLAFVHDTDEPDEQPQQAFKATVQDYVSGYFRKAFTDTESLNLAVVAALNHLPVAADSLTWTDLDEPASVRWRWDIIEDHQLTQQMADRPVLDVYLIPMRSPRLRSTQLEQLPFRLVEDMRRSAFIGQIDDVSAGHDAEAAWAFRPPDWTTRSAGSAGYSGLTSPGYRGVIIQVTAQVAAFSSLDCDWLGALVDRVSLQHDLTELLVEAGQHLPTQVSEVAVAASLAPAGRVSRGDPSQLGVRTSGHFAIDAQHSPPLIMKPSATVNVAGLSTHPGDVAEEITSVLYRQIH